MEQRNDISVIQKLHDSEINARISSFFDGQWRAEIGDEMNGFKKSQDTEDFNSAESALSEMALEIYPDSDFAKANPKAE